MPPGQADGLLEDYARYRRGEAAEVTAAVTGKPGRVARDYAPVFSG